MCRLAWQDGTRWIAATAHQNERWSDVTPEQIKRSVDQLARRLADINLPLTLCPTAEVMVDPSTWDRWLEKELLSVGDRGSYLLIEFPHGLYVDVRHLASQLVGQGIRPILAHAERYPQLLHGGDLVDQLIEIGCLIQVCASSLIKPSRRADQRALKNWIRRGVVHVLGSDGHSCHGRPPRIRAAYETIRMWAGNATADRIGSTNGLAVLQGRPIKTTRPARGKRAWFGLSTFVRPPSYHP